MIPRSFCFLSTNDTFYTPHSLDDTLFLSSTTHRPTLTTYYVQFCTPQPYDGCSSTKSSLTTCLLTSQTSTRETQNGRWKSCGSRCTVPVCGQRHISSYSRRDSRNMGGAPMMLPSRTMDGECSGVVLQASRNIQLYLVSFPCKITIHPRSADTLSSIYSICRRCHTIGNAHSSSSFTMYPTQVYKYVRIVLYI